MNDRTDTPGSTHAISEGTGVRSTLGRTAVLAGFLLVGGVSVGIAYAKLGGRIDNIAAALKTHAEDQNVHLDTLYHMGHGRPVGNFDFTQAIDRFTNALSDVQKRPVLIGGACRKVTNGVLCDQKE